MKHLIVNADDLGFTETRDEGIFESCFRGIVRSVSLVATGAGFLRAARRLLRHPEIDVGLHLDLTEGAPVAPGHRTLVGPDGRFWGKREARRKALAGELEREEVECETAAQIETLRKAGLRIRRLDGHQHIHVYGPIAEAVARAASKAGLRWIRRPVESLSDFEGLEAERRGQLDAYRRLADEAMPIYERQGLRWTEHFIGSVLTGRLDAPRLRAALARVPEGVTELMVHPGRADQDAGFSGADRERELTALTDPEIPAELARLRIGLISFSDL